MQRVDPKWIRNKSDEVAVSQGCYFDDSRAERVREFFRRFIRHTKAPFAGQVFEPLPWQWDRIIAPAFGWMMPDGTRRFREIEVWIPKKNGKTTLTAALAIYLLTSDDEYGSHVYSAASDRNQAAMIYDEAVSMISMNEDLLDSLVVRKAKKIILDPETDSKYVVLTSDGFRNEGLNIHGLLFDELHAQRDRKFWAALRYGSAARRQGMRITLSTAGEHDESSLWWERFHLALRVQESETVDIHLLPCVYAMKKGEDWHDERVWERVNPSYHDTINKLEFRRDYENAKRNAADESDFLRYHLNMPTKFESAWIKNEYWSKCCILQPQEPDPKYVKTKKAYAGVDLADNIDLNALALIYPMHYKDRGDCIQAEFTYWAPEEAGQAHNKTNREKYERWFDSGHLRAMPGAVADQDAIESDIVAICQDFPWPIPTVGIDRYMATRFAASFRDKAKAAKLKTLPRLVQYNYATMNEAVRILEGLIVSGRLIHNGCPITSWMFTNIKATCDSSGNRKLDKGGKSKGKIDGFAALCIALYCMLNEEPEFKSKYSTQKPASILVL